MAWRNKVPLKDRFMRNVSPEPNSGCWLWTGFLAGGYGRFRMTSNPEGPSEGSHRAGWLLFKGEIPKGLIVCHSCDNRACVNPNHLFLGTYADNMQDASKKGRMKWKTKDRNLKRCESHPMSKLTWDEVRLIRNLPINGNEAARRFGITPVTVSRIRRHMIWKEESVSRVS